MVNVLNLNLQEILFVMSQSETRYDTETVMGGERGLTSASGSWSKLTERSESWARRLPSRETETKWSIQSWLVSPKSKYYVPPGPSGIEPSTESQLLGNLKENQHLMVGRWETERNHPEGDARIAVILGEKLLGFVVSELYPSETLTWEQSCSLCNNLRDEPRPPGKMLQTMIIMKSMLVRCVCVCVVTEESKVVFTLFFRKERKLINY